MAGLQQLGAGRAERQAAFFGQAGGCGMPVPAGFGLGHVTHGFQQAGLELVRGQRVQRKRLVFGQFVEFAKADFQPAVQEGGGRLAQETCERDGVGPAVPVRQRQGQCCGGFGRWIGCVVDGAPVAVVGKERRLVRLRAGVRRPGKIARAERLQRMFGGQGGEEAGGGRPGTGRCRLPAGGQIVAQLLDQHRRWPRAVVARAFAHPAQIEAPAGRQQGFEQQIAVVVAARAVAGAVILRHQVKVGAVLAARVVAVVEPQEADHLERDGAHRHQGAEVDRPAEKAHRHAGVGQLPEQHVADHLQRQAGAGEAVAVQRGHPVVERVGNAGVQQQVVFVLDVETGLDQGSDACLPAGRSGGLLQALPPVRQRGEQVCQLAGQRGVHAADFVVWRHALPAGAGTAGIAQQHAIQPEVPAVLVKIVRHAEFGALGGRQPPADAAALDPAGQQRQVGFAQAEAPAYDGHVQQLQYLADGQPQRGQVQQLLQGPQQGFGSDGRLVGQGKRDEARMVGRQLAEDRPDEGCVAADVRHHHHHVARFQRQLGVVEHGQQLVVQDFHFAQRAVGDMKGN